MCLFCFCLLSFRFLKKFRRRILVALMKSLPHDQLALPQRVSFSSVVGSPEKPSASKKYELELFWVLGDAFPAKVFNFENGDDFVRAVDLNKEAMDNAAQLKTLKNSLVDLNAGKSVH